VYIQGVVSVRLKKEYYELKNHMTHKYYKYQEYYTACFEYNMKHKSLLHTYNN